MIRLICGDILRTNLLLTEREGRTAEYWPEVVAVWTERSKVRAKTIEGQYSPVRLELARLVSSLLYGTRAMLILNLPAFESKKYAAYDCFHGNGRYGEIPTKKGPIRTLRFALPYNKGLNFLPGSQLSLNSLQISKLLIFANLCNKRFAQFLICCQLNSIQTLLRRYNN